MRKLNIILNKIQPVDRERTFVEIINRANVLIEAQDDLAALNVKDLRYIQSILIDQYMIFYKDESVNSGLK